MQNKIPISVLSRTLNAGLTDYGLAKSTISQYLAACRQIYDYLEVKGITEYDEDLGMECYHYYVSNQLLCLSGLKNIRKTVRILAEIMAGKGYSRDNSNRTVHYEPPTTEIGQYVTEFLQCVVEQRYSVSTIKSHTRHLTFFAKAMMTQNVTLSDLTAHHILNYVGSLNKSRIGSSISIRAFLKFLHGKGLIKECLATCLYGIKSLRSIPVLTFYSPEEVKRIEESVDRSSKQGKRDYAIILLASRLGLRSSDITNLKFSNIDWDSNLIKIEQYKTKRKIALPLLPDVGDSIIDYLKSSRPIPQNKTEYVFLSFNPPYGQIENISTVAARYIKRANIETQGRHRGLHSLRHSLATSLMNNGENIHIISAALGHRSIESTICYLGTSIENLLECSLPVTIPEDSFYTQRGGIFYE